MCLWRTDPSASRPAWPRSAPPPRRAPPRRTPPVVCPGFGFDKLGFNKFGFPGKPWLGSLSLRARREQHWSPGLGFRVSMFCFYALIPNLPANCISGSSCAKLKHKENRSACYRRCVNKRNICAFGIYEKLKPMFQRGEFAPMSLNALFPPMYAPQGCQTICRIQNPDSPRAEWLGRDDRAGRRAGVGNGRARWKWAGGPVPRA